MGVSDRPLARSPWAFVPALYFLQGLPYVLVQTVTTALFAVRGVGVEQIGHLSSLLPLPWTLKPLWSPLVDLRGTKRGWILACQALVLAGFGALALSVTGSNLVLWATIACGWIAILSATHDVAADGFYLLALDAPAQAAFVGVRSACFRAAMIFGTGGVVVLAGWLERQGAPAAWSLALGAAAAVYGLGLLWGSVALPRPAADGPAGTFAAGRAPFLEALASYFRQPRIVAVLSFILLYRVGESMLTKMAPSFLVGGEAQGGLGLTTSELGLAYGTLGVAALIAGGILGGLWISRRGLARCLWPMAIAMHAPNLLYLWAAIERPGKLLTGAVVAVEQLGYGFGFSAYLVFLMQVSRSSRFPTTHYAISTGLMGLSAQAAGYWSGDLVAALGFPGFFGVVCLAALPGLATIVFVPREETAPDA